MDDIYTLMRLVKSDGRKVVEKMFCGNILTTHIAVTRNSSFLILATEE